MLAESIRWSARHRGRSERVLPLLPYVFVRNTHKVVDWLSDLSWVPNGAIVLISCNGAPGSKRGSPPPRKDGSAASAAVDIAGDGDTPAVVGEGEGPEQVDKDVEEDEEEVLALAALGRIRESYKMRTRGRKSEMGRAGTGESPEEAGKRMAEARRAKEGTAQFRQVSCRGWIRACTFASLFFCPGVNASLRYLHSTSHPPHQS